MNWKVVLSKQAAKNAKKLTACGLSEKAKQLLYTLQENPDQPPYEKLVGNLRGYYYRRINIKHRLVYQVLDEEKVGKTKEMWSHHE